MTVRTAESVVQRADIIEEWLDVLDEVYEEMVSRQEEFGSISGFDNEPSKRPCEHRRQWMHGRLCLACDNTGWRKRAMGEDGIDPYSTEHRRNGVVLRQDESESAKRSREIARLEASIAHLQRNARIRAGAEVREDRNLRQVRMAERVPREVQKIATAMKTLRATTPWPPGNRRQLALRLALIVSGRVRRPLNRNQPVY